MEVKANNTLSSKRSVDLRFPDREHDFGTLRAGDTNGDNMINGADVSYLAPAFLLSSGNARFLPYADLNKDDVINDRDVSGLVCNFLQSGPIDVNAPPTCPTPTPTPTSMPTPGTAAAASAAPLLSIQTDRALVRSGEIFTASLELDLQAATADTIGAYLDFDPRYLEVVDSAGRPASSLDLSAGPFRSATYNVIDNAAGRINLSVSRFSQPWISGKLRIATIRLRAKLPVAQTEISLARDQIRGSDSYRAGYPLGAIRENDTITIAGAVHRVYLPNADH
jgi:hypothetical protein